MYGSLQNRMQENHVAATPEVGMGATILAYTDRYAGTVVRVYPNGAFVVQEDHAKRTDSNGMSESQTYEYSPNPNGAEHLFKRVSRGRAKGQYRENGRMQGNGVMLGVRRKYNDFSF